MENVTNKIEELDVKLEKLDELVEDIELNGHTPKDPYKRQIILSGLTSCEDNVFFEKLEHSLLNKNNSDLKNTIIIGLLLNKKKFKAIAHFVDESLNVKLILDSTFENVQSLILCADALVDAIKSSEDEVQAKYLKSLFNLYIASCNPKSSADIADILLQRFINVLPAKSNIIDNKMIELVKNPISEINSRVVGVDILTRSNPSAHFNFFEELLLNINSFINNASDKLYLLDVLTKAFRAMVISGLHIEKENIVIYLNKLNLVLLEKEISNIDAQTKQNIIKRINARITDITN